MISKATIETKLRGRLCEQVLFFSPEESQLFADDRKERASYARTTLVAYLESEDWFDDIYLVFQKDNSDNLSEPPSREDFVEYFNRKDIVVLVRREDRYEEATAVNRFQAGDFVIALIQRDKYEAIKKLFYTYYKENDFDLSVDLGRV